jgi:hypothetical protein
VAILPTRALQWRGHRKPARGALLWLPTCHRASASDMRRFRARLGASGHLSATDHLTPRPPHPQSRGCRVTLAGSPPGRSCLGAATGCRNETSPAASPAPPAAASGGDRYCRERRRAPERIAAGREIGSACSWQRHGNRRSFRRARPVEAHRRRQAESEAEQQQVQKKRFMPASLRGTNQGLNPCPYSRMH